MTRRRGGSSARHPIGFMSGDTDAYRYVLNCPNNEIDTSGLIGQRGPVAGPADQYNLYMNNYYQQSLDYIRRIMAEFQRVGDAINAGNAGNLGNDYCGLAQTAASKGSPSGWAKVSEEIGVALSWWTTIGNAWFTFTVGVTDLPTGVEGSNHPFLPGLYIDVSQWSYVSYAPELLMLDLIHESSHRIGNNFWYSGAGSWHH